MKTSCPAHVISGAVKSHKNSNEGIPAVERFGQASQNILLWARSCLASAATYGTAGVFSEETMKIYYIRCNRL